MACFRFSSTRTHADSTDSLVRGYKLTFESPKNENLALFRHGERTFDHIIILPPKSKGPSLKLLLRER